MVNCHPMGGSCGSFLSTLWMELAFRRHRLIWTKEKETSQSLSSSKWTVCACAQSYDPMDWSPPASSVRGIFQAQYWSELPFPTPGNLPDPGTAPTSPALADGFYPTMPPGKPRLNSGAAHSLENRAFTYHLPLLDFLLNWVPTVGAMQM